MGRRFGDVVTACNSPEQAVLLTGQAEEYLQDRNWALADGLYAALCKFAPRDADNFHNRGYALERLGRLNEAIGCYGRAIGLRPAFATAHNNLGNALFTQGRIEEAKAQYRRALQMQPDYTAALNNLANALANQRQTADAVGLLQRVVAMAPDYAEGFNNLGFALQKAGRHADALPHLERAVALQPDYAEAHNNLGHSLHKGCRFEEALASFERAITLRPDYAEAVWNRGLVRLLLGNLEHGWQDLEWRWRRNSYQSYPAARDSRPWAGEDLAGRSIAVFVEQGYGDMFQLCRFLLLLIEQGAEVTFASPRVIHRLLTTLSPKLHLLGTQATSHVPDFHCTLFSLPAVLKARLDNLYGPTPYLHAEPDLVERWRQRIGRNGFKVAVSWQGNPAGDVDIGRSIPLRQLAPLANIAGVRLISIQMQHGLDQLHDLPKGMTIETLDDFNEGPDGFIDTAAVLQCVDLVITTDSAPAHLAGAMGVPVWTLLMHVPDWRWLLGRTDSPWYPSMRLYRQSSDGDWDSVVAAVTADLTRLAAATPSNKALP